MSDSGLIAGVAHPDAEAARRLGAEGVHYADAIYQRVGIQFGWVDRLRILFGRVVDVSCSADTEFPIGRIHTREATVRVEPIFRRKFTGHEVVQHGAGMAAGGHVDHGTLPKPPTP